jgi:hypothetical protein
VIVRDRDPDDRPVVKLVGTDGNAFAILGSRICAARRSGWSDARIAEFRAEATSGDYQQLLAIVQDWFDVR